MILRIEGEIARYYVETLCLVFFPGSTFGENEQPGDGVPEVYVKVDRNDSGVLAYISIKLNDRIAEATEFIGNDDNSLILSKESVAVGRAFFSAGKTLLGHIPPWGILTGIRPAKVAGTLLADGNGVIKTKRILRDEYFVNPQKASLAVSVAQNENKIIKLSGKKDCSLYISIPFCPSRCSYCSFVSYTTPRLLSLIDDYLDALISDLDETLEVIRELGFNLSTIYIGGGTPTTLNENQLSKLLGYISSKVDTESLLEFTLEAGRPDTITKEKLVIAKKFGVTRISVNPQTLNDDILKEIGRNHTTEDFYKAYAIAKEVGIRDINVDLIAGLPGDDFKNFSSTLDSIISLNPTNITVHTFCVKKASDALRQNSDIYSIRGGDAAKNVSYAQLTTKFAGYKPYYMYRQKNTVGNLENVGYSIDGHEGLYNIFMMEETQTIFAVGAGAVTKLVDYKSLSEGGKSRISRIFKPKYPYEYLRERNERAEGSATLLQKVKEFFSL